MPRRGSSTPAGRGRSRSRSPTSHGSRSCSGPASRSPSSRSWRSTGPPSGRTGIPISARTTTARSRRPSRATRGARHGEHRGRRAGDLLQAARPRDAGAQLRRCRARHGRPGARQRARADLRRHRRAHAQGHALRGRPRGRADHRALGHADDRRRAGGRAPGARPEGRGRRVPGKSALALERLAPPALRTAGPACPMSHNAGRTETIPAPQRRAMSTETQKQAVEGVDGAGKRDTLSVTDNRTGKSYELEVTDGTVRAMDLRGIKVSDDDFGLMAYDPAFTNTASTRSEITYIDGAAGVLEYRGYSIEQLCEQSNYLEVAYLLIHGELPTKEQFDRWEHEITIHTFVHENVKSFMQGFRYDAHPMGMLLASTGALSTFYPDANQIKDEEIRYLQMVRLVAKMPTLAAFSSRHNMGQPYVYPDNDPRYPGNFLSMMYKMTELKYEPDPRLERALDVLFILHADHEQNCSTSAVRAVGSSQVDPYSAVAAGVAALYGPLHGGANEAVLRMLRRIETKENIPDFIAGVKDGKERLMGFGHRVYKNYDPRAKIIKKACDDVFEVTGTNPLLDIALELEKLALEDDYFVSRKLYPNVDFYSGLIYEALGMPVGMFPVLFAIPRTSGWIAQWLEMIDDPEQKIARPRQIYTGERTRDYVAVDSR